MDKQKLIRALAARREALALSNAQVAERSGLTERSVRNALGSLGNPQLSSLLALVDALELELGLAPKGFGAPTGSDPAYRPVQTRIEAAIAQSPPPPPYKIGKG
ncbi:MAG: transcriptional regulator [Variovorax sp.]